MNFADEISIRILTAMADDPEREFYQREIAKLAGISTGATSQTLRKLSETGLVTLRKSGRMMFYRYNLHNPVAKQLKILLNVDAVDGMIQELRDYAERIILFGSYATGTNVKTSDIDLFILTGNGKKATEIISAYGDKLGRKASPIVVNANELRKLRSEDTALYERVNRGIILWGLSEPMSPERREASLLGHKEILLKYKLSARQYY